MAYGDISSVLDIEAVAGFFATPAPLRIGNGCMITAGCSLTGGGNIGYLRTHSVDGDGSVDTIDTWAAFDSDYGNHGRIVAIPDSTDKYLIYYKSDVTEGFVKSFTVGSTGTITESFADSLEVQKLGTYSGEVYHTQNNDICMIIGNESQLNTFTLDSDGNIGATVIDSFTFGYGYLPDMGPPGPVIHIDGDYYVTSNKEGIATFTVDESGMIALVDFWWPEGESNDIGKNQTIVRVPDTTTYVLLYAEDDSEPFTEATDLRSFTISNTGVITYSEIDTLRVAPTVGESHRTNFFYGRPEITHIGENYFALCTQGGWSTATDGMIYTFTCSDAGIFSDAVLDTLKFHDGAGDFVDCRAPRMVHVRDDIFAVTYYTSDGYNGFITTFRIEAPSAAEGGGLASCALLSPVDAIPTLTSARNTSGYGSGHEPKYTLDNDPDTWWEPNQYATSSLYFDLGQATTVDAIVMWLHNYNENYTNDKSWRVSYSVDDVSYLLVRTHVFADDHTAYSPLVVDKFSEAVNAQYWRIQFVGFDSVPQTIIPEVSCVWIMNDYSLLWKHQRPEVNKALYHNNEVVTRSGHRFTSPAGVGKQRSIQRQFIFTGTVSQWANLKGAYDAARGSNLPIAMQSEFNSDDYHALQFTKPLSEGRQEHGFWAPQVALRELGHMRVPYQNKSLILPYHGAAVYHFRGSAADSGFNGRDWVESGTPVYTADGIAEQGTTVINLSGTAELSIPTEDAGWADMGSNSFTIECWFRGVDDVLLCRKASDNYDLIDAGFFMGVCNQKLCLSISDGSDLPSLSPSPSPSPTPSPSLAIATLNDFSSVIAGTDAGHSDNQWHYVVMVVDRTGNLMHGYVDGGDHSQVDISSITGSISRPDQALLCSGLDKAELYVDELAISPGYVMSAQEVANRYLGRVNYGPWGM